MHLSVIKQQAADAVWQFRTDGHYETNSNDALPVFNAKSSEEAYNAFRGDEEFNKVDVELEVTAPGHSTVSTIGTTLTSPTEP